MKRVAVIVEGDTEERFVNHVLRDELAGVALIPLNLSGGAVSMHYMLGSIVPLMYERHACVTTMVDFYKFKNPARKSGAEDIERELAEAVEEKVRHSRTGSRTVFLPYLQKHEFEALLFADREIMAECLGLSGAQRRKLTAIKGNPEDIDHDHPPSKRIIDIHRKYEKEINGVEIARKIGLAKIARECPRFGGWLAELRKIAGR